MADFPHDDRREPQEAEEAADSSSPAPNLPDGQSVHICVKCWKLSAGEPRQHASIKGKLAWGIARDEIGRYKTLRRFGVVALKLIGSRH